jgi:DinB family protein
MPIQLDKLQKELISQLKGGNAHAKFDDVLKNFPEKLRGMVPEGMPYSAWQLLEHIRIAQDDILRFCRNSDGSYKEMKWPEDYWPKDPKPASARAWTDSIKSYHADLDEFIELISEPNADLFEPFQWGDGQTLFHEAMLLVDHAAYHLGEIVAVRRILKTWPAK